MIATILASTMHWTSWSFLWESAHRWHAGSVVCTKPNSTRIVRRSESKTACVACISRPLLLLWVSTSIGIGWSSIFSETIKLLFLGSRMSKLGNGVNSFRTCVNCMQDDSERTIVGMILSIYHWWTCWCFGCPGYMTWNIVLCKCCEIWFV